MAPTSAETLDETGVNVYPVRILLFRHGFTCGNAGHTAACADPNAPILHLSHKQQNDLFDVLDSIGTKVSAPYVIPRINRSFGIEGRGNKYQGGHPARPDTYRGDDCMLHLEPWDDHPERQWHEAGDVIPMRHYYRDPLLTTCSSFQSHRAGEAFRAWLKTHELHLDFLGASMLVRTFETAYYQLLSAPSEWPHVFSPEMLSEDGSPRVSQLPYVNEFNVKWGYQADDVAWDPEEQKQRLRSVLDEKALQHLDHSQLQNFTLEQQTGHDWEAFKAQVLAQRIVPLVLQRKHGRSAAAPRHVRNGDAFKPTEWADAAAEAAGPTGNVHSVLNVGMASHSGVMQEVCNFATRSASNNAAVEMLLLVEEHSDTGEMVVRQQSGTCALVMDAPKQPEDLDLRDVANCKDPFDFAQAFVSHSSTGNTKCEEVSMSANAYPTKPPTRFDSVDNKAASDNTL